MKDSHSLFDSLRSFDRGNGGEARFYSLPALEEKDIGPISSLPVCLRIILESVLRNYDGNEITENHVRALANWQPNGKRTDEVPFNLARILCQDFTGVPLVVDLAAMRSTMARLGKDPAIIEPIVPVDLIIDHSVQTDFAGVPDAFNKNLELEFKRNAERYRFLKWGTSAFKSFNVIPPAIGIIHQVNLEFLAKGVIEKNNLCFPDTLAGTDSHTTMINGLGIVAWGVGGIEAEAGMLGQPLYFLTPDVVGVHLTGSLPDGTTATDAALRVTEMLRKENVVGKFVEFYGPGAEAMHVVDRATIANMSPEYGATMGFFPVDSKCVDFLNDTGRSEEHCRLYENYYKSQGMFGIPRKGQIRYSKELELELTSVTPSVSGPKRPQDRIELYELKNNFDNALTKSAKNNGFNKQPEELNACADITLDNNEPLQLKHGSVVIASITSCTNTSNPSLMLAAGLLAKKAVEKGLSINPAVKASLAPGSRVVTKYLQSTGLQESLDKLGFHLA
ncbi:MAG: aconitate hydratase AcnA, partial [Verrucomicrobia bacterium]|nr:aconitate hydratase AcnA [Verrucomicrobiota bacterium]